MQTEDCICSGKTWLPPLLTGLSDFRNNKPITTSWHSQNYTHKTAKQNSVCSSEKLPPEAASATLISAGSA